MGNKEKYCKVLEDVLGNKLGGTKYKELGSNLGPVTASYLKEKLNENGYIVPGLGDAGDRIFGTK